MSKKYCPLPPLNPAFIDSQRYFFLFETALCDKENYLSYIFVNPIDSITVHRYSEVATAFKKVERYAKTKYLCGYFSYELGYYFENKAPQSSCPFPLIQLFVFDKAVSFNHTTGEIRNSIHSLFQQDKSPGTSSISNPLFNLEKPAYEQRIKQLKSYIKQGDTYQVNFTGKFRFRCCGSPWGFYQDLKSKQRVPYAAFCKYNNEYAVSLSPELFFRRRGSQIYSRPMKGTIARGKTIQEDIEKIDGLKEDPKTKAENLMIVDLIRNDLGRICRVGSVRVTELFSVERYATLFQMTSTIKGTLRHKTTYFDIFKALFPGGSVTGAPKIRTMEIIQALEEEERKLYCGALGVITPRSRAVFNLPIRTISLAGRKGEMGIGSGIVSDSKAEREFEECILKARFLTDPPRDFQLLETMLWDARFIFLREHLRRMQDSACYFDFHFYSQEIVRQLCGLQKQFQKGLRYRIRLLVGEAGGITIEYSKLATTGAGKEQLAVLSQKRVNPEDAFYYHKTTNRRLYDEEYRFYSSRGYYDVIFLNERQEVSEGAVSNIIIQKDKQWFTPPISSGLLAGIARNYLLSVGRVKEKIIRREELFSAKRVFLCNSVRGLVEVKLKRD